MGFQFVILAVLSVTARRRQARGANQVIRRFMKDLLQTAATRLVAKSLFVDDAKSSFFQVF
jgi:hypothetical protein